MNMQQAEDVLAHLKNAESQISTLLGQARSKIKAAIGDQSGDGKVDLADVKVRVGELVTGTEQFASATLGAWKMRDTKIAAGFAFGGYVFAKVFPIVKPFLAALF